MTGSFDSIAYTVSNDQVVEVVNKLAFALNPRGEFYTQDNIKEKLSIRNLMDEIRGTGQLTGGPAPLTKKDNQKFANALDTFLAKC